MTHQEEVDRNYEVFLKQLPTLLATHRDKFALMKNAEVLGFYSTAEDARVTACSFIKDGVYSIQQVTDAVINLGFYTNAVPVDNIHP